MKLKVLSVAALAVILLSCQSQPSALDKLETGTPVTLSPVDLAAIDLGVRSGLKDPFSAIVSGVRGAVGTQSGVMYACGYVNAKNSFGAYTGNMPFSGVLATNTAGQRVFATGSIGDGGIGSQVVFEVCQRQGMAI